MAIFESNLATTLNTTLQAMLKGGIIDADVKAQRAVYVSIKLESARSSTADIPEVRYVHVVYYCRSNYVMVGSQISENGLLPDRTIWNWAANHDSCWRDAASSLILNVGMEMCRMVDPNTAPVNLWTSSSLDRIQVWEVTDVKEFRSDAAGKTVIQITFP